LQVGPNYTIYQELNHDNTSTISFGSVLGAIMNGNDVYQSYKRCGVKKSDGTCCACLMPRDKTYCEAHSCTRCGAVKSSRVLMCKSCVSLCVVLCAIRNTMDPSWRCDRPAMCNSRYCEGHSCKVCAKPKSYDMEMCVRCAVLISPVENLV
jgi:hypothetical protein